ncbi:MAG: molybdate ABC transporter substrate-binding protein [Pseudomonadota bacterium]
MSHIIGISINSGKSNYTRLTIGFLKLLACGACVHPKLECHQCLCDHRCVILRYLIVCLALWVPDSRACPVRIAVASNFEPTLRSVISTSETLSDHKIQIISGSSGRLFMQIVNGAPFDLYFSADVEKPSQLAAMGMTMGAPWVYAYGRLALWTPDRAAENRPIPGPMALANPRVAPYGVAARAWISSLSEADRPATEVVAENVAHAFHFANSRNAGSALVSLAQLLAESIPEREYQLLTDPAVPAITQAAVQIKRGGACAKAQEVYLALQAPEARAHIRRQGYNAPDPSL